MKKKVRTDDARLVGLGLASPGHGTAKRRESRSQAAGALAGRAGPRRCQWRRAQCGEVWLSPDLGPAHSGNIHRPMKKVRFTSLTLAAATSSVRPSRPRCAPRRRAPDALAQIPAPCSGTLALRPSGPDAPGHLAASPAPCCRLQWRAGAHALRPSSPARRLGDSPCPRRAWVPSSRNFVSSS